MQHWPSGSDHSKSHIGPSCGTSCFLSIARIWSSVCIEGDNPPCTQNICVKQQDKLIVIKSCTDNQTHFNYILLKGGGNLILPKNISLILKSTNKKYL